MNVVKKNGIVYKKIGSFVPGETITSTYKDGTTIKRRIQAFVPPAVKHSLFR